MEEARRKTRYNLPAYGKLYLKKTTAKKHNLTLNNNKLSDASVASLGRSPS